jgi:hypothetical protein
VELRIQERVALTGLLDKMKSGARAPRRRSKFAAPSAA